MFKNRVRYYWVRYISFFNCYIDLLVSNNKRPTQKDHIQPEHSQNLQNPPTTPFAHKIKIIILSKLYIDILMPNKRTPTYKHICVI
jgi:hypothetical protein